MALVFADRVKATTTTTGTGTYTLGSAVTGFQSFAVIGNGNTCYYAATDGTSWEVGLGTYTSTGTTLARTTVLASSNSGSAVNWSAGTKTIWVDLPKAHIDQLPLYSEGTWTPVLQFGGASTGIIYGTQEGRYRKVANLVYLWGQILLTNKGSATGNAQISGSPFTPTGANFGTTAGTIYIDNMTGLTGAARVGINAFNIFLTQTSAIGDVAIGSGVFTNASALRFSIVYPV